MSVKKETGKKGGIPWLWIGLGALLLGGGGFAAYTIFKKQTVHEGENVTTTTYRVLGQRRPGFQYVAAQQGPNNSIMFTSPVNATFTANVVQEGGGYFAELKA